MELLRKRLQADWIASCLTRAVLFVGEEFFVIFSSTMEFYLVSSKLMYSMRCNGSLLKRLVRRIEKKYKIPKNIMFFCIILRFFGFIVGYKVLGWFVEMSVIDESIICFFALASVLVITKRDGNGGHQHCVQCDFYDLGVYLLPRLQCSFWKRKLYHDCYLSYS